MNAIFLFDPPVYSLDHFEKSHCLNHVLMHRLLQIGLHPQTIIVGTKAMVTREAAAAWRQKITEYAEQHGGKIEL